MSSLFSFRFSEPGSERKSNLLIYSTSKPTMDMLARVLKQEVESNLAPKKVYLLSPSNCALTQQQCRGDAAFVSEYDAYVGDIDFTLFCINADYAGTLTYCDGNMLPEQLCRGILQQGMIALFKKHSGLIVSNHGYHFVKPSGDHCDKFIRASNLLVSSTEVSFLATSILLYLKRDLKRIYVDTSSISFLVSIALGLTGYFSESQPVIESFESYAALNEPYDFVEDEFSLVFISATTSGSLAKRLLTQTRFGGNQIVTLFHMNLPGDQLGIFDISPADREGIISKIASDCPFCKLGSKQIRIAGDQFLPENPKHDQLVIRKTDFGKERQEFFKLFAANRVLEWNTATSYKEESREHFYISVEQAIQLDEEKLKNNILKNIKRYTSRDLATVITFNDTGSKEFSESIKRHLGEDAESIGWLDSNSFSEQDVRDTASVLVIAGAITSGRSLLSISRRLRCIDTSASIVYLVVFSKLPSQSDFLQLKADLGQGGHELVVLMRCPVPRIKEHTKTPWDWEREVLQPYSEEDPLGEVGHPLPTILASRYASITGSNHGSDDLFLPDSEGKALNLRRTFAFWSDLGFSEERLKNTTQADVYWTIQCVLHDLRTLNESGGLATTYHTTLINPANFDRYNDGIIQACLLRSALPVELDYRVDPAFSRRMADVILSVVNNWNNEQGEATLEFLMALWSQRLRLAGEHLREVCNLRSEEMNEELRFLFDRLHNLLEARSAENGRSA